MKWEKELCYFASSVGDWEEIWKILTALGTFSDGLKLLFFPDGKYGRCLQQPASNDDAYMALHICQDKG